MTYHVTIDNPQDIMDCRDVIKRQEELQDERDDLQSAVDKASVEISTSIEAHNATEDQEETLANAQCELEDWDSENSGELKALSALEDLPGDARHGEAMIRDSYFEKYAEVLADDLGMYDPHKLRWPLTCIDWEKAAEELKQDYTSVDFDGVEYWVRG